MSRSQSDGSDRIQGREESVKIRFWSEGNRTELPLSQLRNQRKLPERDIKIAVCQMTSTDSVAENKSKVLDSLSELNRHGACDLVCFPENALYLRLKDEKPSVVSLDDEFFGKLKAICLERDMGILIGSVPIQREARVYNTTLWICPLGIFDIYDKVHLFDVDIVGLKPIRESDNFSSGDSLAVLEWKGWKIGLSICYDIRFSELYYSLALAGAHALMVPAAFTHPTGMAHWHTLLKARAIESQSYVVAAAQTGWHVGVHGGKRQTFGHSLIVDPWGEVLCDLGDTGTLGVSTLSVERLKKVQEQIPMALHRRINLQFRD